MKAALLHYWLTNVRGGEKVLAALARLLPGADVFTHAYLPGKMQGMFDGRRVTESFIARLPFGRRHPQMYLPLMSAASRAFDLRGYGLIVSSESGPVKGISKPRGARHVCYCHTPMRYVWDMYGDYYRAAGLGGKAAMRLFTGMLRREDLKSAESVDEFVANSAFVAERIRRIYSREAVVVHPPVDVGFFAAQESAPASAGPLRAPFDAPYYLLAGELVPYKRPDLAMEACGRMGRRLVVVGDGKMRESLAACAPRGTVFLGRADAETLRAAYANARALIFPGVEDFGIVPVEAQAAGTPVVAFGRGGALETVADGETGLFFREQTVDSLCGALEEFEARGWSKDACRANARRFSEDAFAAGMGRVLKGGR